MGVGGGCSTPTHFHTHGVREGWGAQPPTPSLPGSRQGVSRSRTGVFEPPPPSVGRGCPRRQAWLEKKILSLAVRRRGVDAGPVSCSHVQQTGSVVGTAQLPLDESRSAPRTHRSQGEQIYVRRRRRTRCTSSGPFPETSTDESWVSPVVLLAGFRRLVLKTVRRVCRRCWSCVMVVHLRRTLARGIEAAQLPLGSSSPTDGRTAGRGSHLCPSPEKDQMYTSGPFPETSTDES